MLSASSLANDLFAMFNNVAPGVTAKEKADQMAMAIFNYVMAGKPMCVVTTFPGPAGGISGLGIGGVDKPTPGSGLMASFLEAQILSLDAFGSARNFANAIHTYFSQAIIMTTDKNGGPPVISGTGGVGAPSPGMGYESARPILGDSLYTIYFAVQHEISMMQKVKEISAAIHAFCKEGKVSTKGLFSAPPVGPGVFGPGVGTSVGEFS
jgi:hypothetical protein